MLIWAHPAVPDRFRSLAELFRERTEVGLTVYPPGTAPDSVDVFDYAEPTTAGDRLLFSARPVPPEQGTAKERVFERGSRWVTWLALLALLLGLAGAAAPPERFLLLGGGLWLAIRAPIGPALGLQPLFSPGTFFRPLLGPLSSSSGVLALSGTLLTIAAVWLWRRRLPRRWYGVALGGALLLPRPTSSAAWDAGSHLPPAGVSVGLWLTWQLAILVSASALIVPTAALFRGAEPAVAPPWRIGLGVTIALAAAVIGVLVWSPRGGWPDWYTFLWTPALVLVCLPAPRWAAIGGIALVAGSSAALVTWGAEISGKIQVAQRDVARLGVEPDPLAVPLLERFGEQVLRSTAPTTASEMYALWHGSALGHQGYPAQLALWGRRGTPLDELRWIRSICRPSLLSTMVQDLPQVDSLRIAQVARVPGVHYVLLVRLTQEEVMTAAVGPRSELILPGRVGRLLEPSRSHSPLYQLTLAPPLDPSTVLAAAALASRGVDRAKRVSAGAPRRYPGGSRGHRPARPGAAAGPRGTGRVARCRCTGRPLVPGGGRIRRPPASPAVAEPGPLLPHRLAVTLAAFFLIPAVGFAIWSFARLAQEVERSRDLLITQTLRDAVITGGASLRSGGPTTEDRLQELSRRIDADLALYRGGRLAATSTQVLEDLGVMPQLMDPDRIRGGRAGRRPRGDPGRLDSRPGGAGRLPGDPAGRRRPPSACWRLRSWPTTRRSPCGSSIWPWCCCSPPWPGAAALVGAGRASRSLSRPVAELRRSALALGRGQSMAAHSENPPLEFEPVFGAFERMASDIRSSQEALDAARRRTAAVLATVATGVVGLDPEGRVLIANRQAVDLLGDWLAEGIPFLPGLGREWAPLAEESSASSAAAGPRRSASWRSAGGA